MKNLPQNENNELESHRTFRHIWFFANTQAKIKNQKSLHFAITQINLLTLKNDIKNIR